jgi:hypothetical protein
LAILNRPLGAVGELIALFRVYISSGNTLIQLSFKLLKLYMLRMSGNFDIKKWMYGLTGLSGCGILIITEGV